MIEGEAKSNKY